jgi:cyclophilin family peptidyl-prolyl cis-trans isomerase
MIVLRMYFCLFLGFGGLSLANELELRSGKVLRGTVVTSKKTTEVVSAQGEITTVDNRLILNEKKIAPSQKTKAKNPIIRFQTSLGNMDAELYEDLVPNTVANIITLAEHGFYNGQSFHRVIKGFMAQGGCPNSKRGSYGRVGTGGPGYRIADEFDPSLSHSGFGILSMANSGPNTAGSQFFICFQKTPWLNGKHAVFGRIIKGFDVLHKIEQLGSTTGKPSQRIAFTIKVVYKRKHKYVVKKI